MSHPQRHRQQGSNNRSIGVGRENTEAATCTFWERGRCTRGEDCRFNHYYSSSSANSERGVIGNAGDATSGGSLRPPASIDEPCKYYWKPTGCRMGDRCAYRHSSYRTDENLRRRAYERQNQPTILDANQRVFDEEVEELDDINSSVSSRRVGGLDEDDFCGSPYLSDTESDEIDIFAPYLSENEEIHFYGAAGAFRGGEVADMILSMEHASRDSDLPNDDGVSSLGPMSEKPCDSQSSCPQPLREVCHFYLNGNCTRGVQCLYAHPVEADELDGEQDDVEASPPICGICLESVTKFGILTGCEHGFCLTCLGKWRHKGKGSSQIDLTAIRGCPVCRKPSFFIIPSTTFVAGKKKHELIEAYKDNLARIPCRNFKYNDSDSCPFGSRCFFLHQGPQGQRVKKESVRIRQDAEGITEVFSSLVTINDAIHSSLHRG